MKKPQPNSTFKVRFLPSIDQKQIFRRWLGTERFCFNRTISKISNDNEKIDFQHLRNLITPKKVISDEEQWLLDTPKDIRAEAVREAVTAYKSCFTNLKRGNITKFKVSYRSKKRQQTEVINIPYSAIKVLDEGISIYKKYISTIINLKKKSDLELFGQNYNIKILYHKSIDKWFLLIPRVSFHTTENQGGMVALDPGERSFFTAYGEKGTAFKFGYQDMKKKILPILKKIDRKQSLIDRKIVTGGKKRRLRYKIRKLRYKIKNLISEIHHKTSSFLCSRYNIIILPHFNGKQMAEDHILSHEINRRMLCWNHFRFRELLKNKAQKYLNCRVLVCTEEYTTSTCGYCGSHNNRVRSAEVFRCSQCNTCMDRDLNAARNIMLKTLTGG